MKKSIIAMLAFMGMFTFLLFNADHVKMADIESPEVIGDEITTTTSDAYVTADNAETTKYTITTGVLASYEQITVTAANESATANAATTVISATVKTDVQTETKKPATATTVTATVKYTETATVTATAVTTAESKSVSADPVETPEGNLRLLGSLKITGYVATGKKTASGVYPYVGGVAMSKKYGLPWGTKIYIEGLGYYTLNDTGCKYGVVDVFCSSVKECYALTSNANVYVVE